MSECPHCKITHKLRADLPQPMPDRFKRLPVGPNGYPVPYFVADPNDFRVASSDKVVKCHKEKRCWVCGEQLGIHIAFVIGPMCTVNKLSGDPGCHLECAEYSVRSCPFMMRPHMVRREDEKTDALKENTAGIMIERNPGVMAIWVTKSYKVERDGPGYLFRLGDPVALKWYREGRPATRAEITNSIETGLPKLREVCASEEEHAALDKAIEEARKLLPAR